MPSETRMQTASCVSDGIAPIRRLQTRLSAPTVRTALFESSTP
ncbi:hypothetical protein [Neisseria lactamica]|nr:hypothetical protein [Neisseria lactamica]